jgi:hypothetical protein
MEAGQHCRQLVSERTHPDEAVTACQKVVDLAEKFPPTHYITRRGAYVFMATALIQNKNPQEAVKIADKAVAIVQLGHDDGSGSSAAYSIRSQAKALAGDLDGSDKDLSTAEAYERNALNSPAGEELKVPYSRALKELLMFHAQVLAALGRQSASGIKLDEANKL